MSIRNHIAFALDTMTPATPLAVVPKCVYKTEDGIMLAYGTTVPVDTTAGYAPLCLFWDATKLYANTGTKASSLFLEIAPGFVGDITGDVTGNLTGDSAGTHVGPVTGALTGASAGVHTGGVIGDIAGLLNATAFAGSVTTTAPSAAELVTILGAAGTAGRIRSVTADAGSGSGESYLVMDTGSVWAYIQMTNSA